MNPHHPYLAQRLRPESEVRAEIAARAFLPTPPEVLTGHPSLDADLRGLFRDCNMAGRARAVTALSDAIEIFAGRDRARAWPDRWYETGLSEDHTSAARTIVQGWLALAESPR